MSGARVELVFAKMPFQTVANHMRRAVNFGRARAQPLDQMLFVLPDLRTPDPLFLQELKDGRFALGSGPVTITAVGAFDGPIANDVQRRELYSLSWLRHLHAARTTDAEDLARTHLLAWSRSRARRSAVAAEPMVRARRALSLLAHVDIALSGARTADFDTIMDLVGEELSMLAASSSRLPLALPRLITLIALTAFQVCSGADNPAARRDIERRLSTDLEHQILRDGGHISRNPAVLLDLALDLVPLQRVYAAAQLPLPSSIVSALQRSAVMLVHMSHGDRQLGRFNGAGATALTEIATALKVLPLGPAPITRHAQDTGFIRLQCNDTVILFDGGPGERTPAGDAPFAGALSFEVSVSRVPLVVNTGSDHGAWASPRLDARATSAHSAATLGASSSAVARSGDTKAALVKEPGDEVAATIRASSDGFRAAFGWLHRRTLSLLRDGDLIEGADVLEPAANAAAEVPFAVHFHLHPTVYVSADAPAKAIRLTAADGSRWSMTCSDHVTVRIEPSTFHAGISGPKASLQLVLRGVACGETTITWRLERMSPAAVS